MTIADVQKLVAAIKEEAHDPELAHLNEDTLHRAVLTAIAEGAPHAVMLAQSALETTYIKFARWCA